MDKNDFKNSKLKEAVELYFKGLTLGYSPATLRIYRRKLEEFGITDFEQLKTYFRNGKY